MTAPAIPILEALKFAAHYHRDQRRSGLDTLPYINHLIKVAARIADNKADLDLIVVGVLHDILEDTDVTSEMLIEKFGNRVNSLVVELTDDMNLPYHERKQMQVDKAQALSRDAVLVRIIDKTANVEDIGQFPINWSLEQKMTYIDFSKKVVDQIRDIHPKADAEFDRVVNMVTEKIKVED